MINVRVLVLNRYYQPVHVTTLKRAYALLYCGNADAVDRDHRAFDFETWACQLPGRGEEHICTPRRKLRIPRVIALRHYERPPRRYVRFTRANVFSRDGYRCPYCGRSSDARGLNLDHVVPRSRGGASSWENVVSSCVECNLRKGGRVPEEAGMRLARPPRRPGWAPLLRMSFAGGGDRHVFDEWLPFLSAAPPAFFRTTVLGSEHFDSTQPQQKTGT
jgi:5-methylcytosine-specific restriction endonuclease McrA